MTQAIDQVADGAGLEKSQRIEHETLICGGFPVEIGQNQEDGKKGDDHQHAEPDRLWDIAHHAKGNGTVFHIFQIEEAVDDGYAFSLAAHKPIPCNVLFSSKTAGIAVCFFKKAFVEELRLRPVLGRLIDRDRGYDDKKEGDKRLLFIPVQTPSLSRLFFLHHL